MLLQSDTLLMKFYNFMDARSGATKKQSRMLNFRRGTALALYPTSTRPLCRTALGKTRVPERRFGWFPAV